jgi:integral membrane protein
VSNQPVRRVRLVGLIEGVSFLVLLLIAMPLKYLAGIPLAVLIVGWLHGVLFMTYAVVAVIAWQGGHLSTRLLSLAAIASVVPGGPFVLDHRLKAIESNQTNHPEQVC